MNYERQNLRKKKQSIIKEIGSEDLSFLKENKFNYAREGIIGIKIIGVRKPERHNPNVFLKKCYYLGHCEYRKVHQNSLVY